MPAERIRLLLVDDEPGYLDEMAVGLSSYFDVDTAADGRAALDLVADRHGRYDVALIDQHLGSEPDGITLLSRIRQTYPDIEGIVLTGYAAEDRERAVAAGAFGYVSRSTVEEPELFQLINLAPQQARLRALSRAIFSRLESEEVACQGILRATAGHLEATAAALTLYDAAADRWRAYYLDAPPDDARAPLANRRLVEAISAGGPPVVHLALDVAQDRPLFDLGLASLAAAPVVGRAGFIGALIVYSREANHFSSDRPTGLQTLASWAGPALDIVHDYLKIKDQAGDLQTLQELAREIASSLDTATVGNQTCVAAVKFFGADHSGLLRFSENDSTGQVIAEWPHERGTLGARVQLRDVRLEQRLIRERRPLPVPSVAQCDDLGPVRELLLSQGIRATLIVPVVAAENRLLGSFSIDFDEERSFNNEDETYALMFASWAAIALDHANVYREAERTTRQLDSLERAARQLRETNDAETLNYQIVRGAREVMGCDAACLILNHRDQKSLELIAHDGLPTPPTTLHWPYGLSLAGRAAREGRVVRCGRYDDTLEVDPPLREYDFSTSVAAPLLIRDEVRAILLLLGRQPRLCDQSNENILSRYVNQAAGQLRTSQAMSMSQRSIDQLMLLHRINVEIRDGAALQDTLHMVLTAVTANFGHQMNCAALWLLDESDPAGPALVGHTAIGHFNRAEAQADYETIQRQGSATFGNYCHDLKAGRFRSEHTPLHRAIAGRRVPLSGDDWLLAQMRQAEVLELKRMDEPRLPRALRETYRPDFPLLLAPLIIDNRPLGLLLADNRIIRAPLSEGMREGLGSLAAAAAVAIDSDRSRAERERQVAELRQRDEQRERVWRATTEVAAKVVQEELEPALNAIASSVAAAMGAEVVTVYAYDAATRRFTDKGSHIDNQRVPDSVRPPDEIPLDSALYEVIGLQTAPYRLLNDTTRHNAALMQGNFVRQEGIRASVGLQLRSRGECVGVLLVNYREAHHFDENELESIQSFANQAAAAVYGQKKFRDATDGNRQLEALRRAALSIGDARELDKTLHEIACQALVVVGATDSRAACHVALLHGKALQFRGASSPETLQRLRDEVGVIRLDAPRRPSIIARVALSGVSENLPYAPDDKDYWPFEPHTQSQLAVVVSRGATVIGVINLEHPQRAHFTDKDMAAMERLAAVAAVSIQAAEHLGQREIVARISRQVNTCHNLDDFLQAIFGELDGIFQRHEIGIRLGLGHYEPEAARLRMRRIPQPPGEGRPYIALNEEKGIIRRVAVTRRPYYADDVNNHNIYHLLWPDTASEMAVPVEYEGELLAVLDLQSTVPDAFTVEDQNLVTILAEQVATTIHNLHLTEELIASKKRQANRVMLKRLGAVTHSWMHHVRQKAQIIIESVDVLELDLGHKDTEGTGVTTLMQQIRRQAEAIKRRPLKTSPERVVQPLAANDLLRHTTEQLRAEWSVSETRRQIAIVEDYTAPEEDRIRVDIEEFESIVENILENAGRYLRGKPQPRIDIATRRVDNFIEMRFADNGPGIAPERRPLLYEDLVPKEAGELGDGIGLYIAKALMDEYGGRVWDEDNIPRGTIFTLAFPVIVAGLPVSSKE